MHPHGGCKGVQGRSASQPACTRPAHVLHTSLHTSCTRPDTPPCTSPAPLGLDSVWIWSGFSLDSPWPPAKEGGGDSAGELPPP